MKKIIFLSFIFLLFCTGCLNNPPISFIDFSKTTPITKNTINNNDTKPLKIAVATVLSPNVTISNYRNIAKYISEKTNRPTLLIQRKTYEELNILMSNGEADIAFMSTGAYSSYRGLNEIELLAMVAYKKTATYFSQVIVHKDSSISTLADLQGKTFAFTDPLSYSGHIAILNELHQSHNKPETFFSRYIYTYGHDKSIWAVANKVVDAASIDSMILEHSQKYTPWITANIKVISSIGPYPTGPVVIRKSLPPEIKTSLKTSLLNMHEDSANMETLNGLLIDRFIEPNPEAYLPLIKNYQQVGDNI